MPSTPGAGDASTAPSSPSAFGRLRSALARPEGMVAATVALVFFAMGLAQLFSSIPSIGDWAVAELVVRHVGRHIPLSGPYSAKRGFNHPLPFVYLLQWLPYQLTGSRSSSAEAAAVWFNGALLAGLVVVLRRRALGLSLLVLAAVALLALKRGNGVLLMPWNPNLAIVPSLVLVFVAWRVACGSARLLPVAVGLGAWSVGAHAGFAPLVVATLGVALVGLVAGTVRREGSAGLRPLWRPALAALAVGVVLLSPMAIDAVRNGGDSNPARLLRGYDGDGQPVVEASEAVKVLRAELAIPPAWSQRKPPYSAYLFTGADRIPVLVPIALLVGFAAWRRRAFQEVAGIAIAGIGVLGAAAGLLRIQDQLFQPWYLYPIHVAAMALGAFVLWSGLRSAGAWIADRREAAGKDRPLPAVPRFAPVAAAAVLSLAVWPSLHPPEFHEHVQRDVSHLAEAVEARFEPGQRILLDGPVDVDGYYSAALTLMLDRAGFDVRVPASDGYIYTGAMTQPAGWTGTELRLEFSAEAPTSAPPGEELIATIRLDADTPLPQAPHLTLYERIATG